MKTGSENSENIRLLQEFENLRKNNVNLIAVSNSEWYSLFRDEIRNSIAIEGIFTNRNELLEVLEKNKRGNDEKSAAILGYFEAASALYEYANNLHKEKEFSLRISDIKQIHTLLMRYEKQNGSFKGRLGEFRTEPVEVNNARFSPLKYIFVRETMEAFVKWINEKLQDAEYDKIKLAVESHLLFETIHPFTDGNGRAGRILLSYILIGCGYVNIAIKGSLKSDREIYYDAMESGDDQFELLLRKFEKGTKISSKEINKTAQKSDVSLLKEIVVKRLVDAMKRLSKKEIVAINGDAVLPLRDAAKFYNYSQDYLRNLINSNKLPARKKGKLWFVKIRDIEKYIKNLSER